MRILLPTLLIFSCSDATDVQDSGTPRKVDPVTTEFTKNPSILREIPKDFELVFEDMEAYGELGFVLQTWSLSADAPNPYESLKSGSSPDTAEEELDLRPSFAVVRSADPDFEPSQVLIWMHGGTVADDAAYPETGELPDPCATDTVINLAASPTNTLQLQIIAAVDAGFAVLLPRNDWCDAWLGLGAKDPHRTWHYGNYHLDRMLEFAQHGGLGFHWPGKVSLWGTSAGGTGAMYWAARRKSFHSLVVDSSPSNWFAYYVGDPETVASHFGGPPFEPDGTPSEFYDYYADATGWTLLESGKLETPLFLAWNIKDEMAGKRHAESMLAVFDAEPLLLGGLWGQKDFNRYFPGSKWHVQTTGSDLPPAYAGASILRFLQEHHLLWVEAEEGCASPEECTVGEVVAANIASPGSDRLLSDSGGVVAPSDGTGGILWQHRIDSWFPGHNSVEARFAVAISGPTDLNPDTVVGQIVVGGDQGPQKVIDLLASDMHIEDEGEQQPTEPTVDRRIGALRQIKATTLTIDLVEGETTTLAWKHTGAANTVLDYVVFFSPWD